MVVESAKSAFIAAVSGAVVDGIDRETMTTLSHPRDGPFDVCAVSSMASRIVEVAAVASGAGVISSGVVVGVTVERSILGEFCFHMYTIKRTATAAIMSVRTKFRVFI